MTDHYNKPPARERFLIADNTSPPRLIGFCSPAMGSGKTTAARHLVDAHGFTRMAFATPLKAMTVAMLQATGMPDDEVTARVFGDRKEEPIPAVYGMTSRQLQQLIGTEFGRDMINPDIWVDLTMAAVRAALDQGKSVVIDDLRFKNEYEAIMAAGGECVRIVRPDYEVTTAHASEGELDLVAMREIWNQGDVRYLHRIVDDLLRA